MMNNLSSIGIKESNGQIKAVSCDWNGNIYHDGQILANCWSTPETVHILIGLGDLVSLGPSLHDIVSKRRDYDVAWALVAPQMFSDVKQWMRRMRVRGCGAYYLFVQPDMKWIAIDRNGKYYLNLDEYVV